MAASASPRRWNSSLARSLRGRRERRALDQRIDFGKAAMRVVIGDRRSSSVDATCSMDDGRCVSMIVRVPVVVIVMIVFVGVGVVAVLCHDELRRRHAGAQHLLRRDLGPVEREAPKRPSQFFERQPGIDERPQHHVARRAVETIEIQNPRHSFALPFALCSLPCQGTGFHSLPASRKLK